MPENFKYCCGIIYWSNIFPIVSNPLLDLLVHNSLIFHSKLSFNYCQNIIVIGAIELAMNFDSIFAQNEFLR